MTKKKVVEFEKKEVKKNKGEVTGRESGRKKKKCPGKE